MHMLLRNLATQSRRFTARGATSLRISSYAKFNYFCYTWLLKHSLSLSTLGPEDMLLRIHESRVCLHLSETSSLIFHFELSCY